MIYQIVCYFFSILIFVYTSFYVIIATEIAAGRRK